MGSMKIWTLGVWEPWSLESSEDSGDGVLGYGASKGSSSCLVTGIMMMSNSGGISGVPKDKVISVMTDPQGLNILILAGVYLKGINWTTLLYFLPVLEHVKYPFDEHSALILRFALIGVPFVAPNQLLSSSSKVRIFSMVSE